MFSPDEKIAHVVRRLGMGTHPDVVAGAATPEDAIAAALDLSTEPAPRPQVEPPLDVDEARMQRLEDPILFWQERMTSNERLIEERLVWFWHDHFATSVRKVRFPYLMWSQHLTIRDHATGSFADLLQAIAIDPAMLMYLDGTNNHLGAINENFGREVMELYTMGLGAYTQKDVVEAARSFSGWVVAVPRERRPLPEFAEPWSAVFVPFRHDDGQKTLLGVTGDHDTRSAIEILLDRPETAQFVAAKLFTHLTGQVPDAATVSRLGEVFGADYRIMPLVEEIVADPTFLSEEAIRAKVRSPLEKGIGVVQAFPTHEHSLRAVAAGLDVLAYVPFVPPNPAGYPEGLRLIGPHSMVHTLDFAIAVNPAPLEPMSSTEMMARLGIFDVSQSTLAVLDAQAEPFVRAALAIGSPEYALV